MSSGDAALALGLEAAIGYPEALGRCLPHPVVWMGRAIEFLELHWNRPRSADVPVRSSRPSDADDQRKKRADEDVRAPCARRGLGVATVSLVAGASGLLAWAVERACGPSPAGRAAAVLAATPGLAQRSLREHVEAVRAPLERGDLAAARQAVSRIVGRDVAALDASAIAAAALESLAESFNDGVVAPAFWLALAGLPGLYVYKAVNTADSLIGHREPRWRLFGWAAARLDDAMNLIPARLAGALIALAGGSGWRIMLRDAPQHASPNAGWPEAAMAGALGVQLGGPATYDGVPTERPRFGDGPRPAASDLARGLAVYGRACLLLGLCFGAVAVARRRRRP
ncbi:MAG TPA: adenosylcobinamide-phosphate synthase CbiB [Caulobacteraceae bacterium]|nr:adenosylcobinamide-phosphate synthase CbiB [Caulobacteraceae bacterium]